MTFYHDHPHQPGEQTAYDYQPGQVYPQQRRPVWPWLALAVAVVFLASAGWFAYTRVIKKDSGIAACEAMAGGQQIVGGVKVGKDQRITEAQYRQLRKVFEDSRFDDIRSHGTKLVDIVWQFSQLGDKPGVEALVFVGPLTQELSGLQSACADHGIIVAIPAGK